MKRSCFAFLYILTLSILSGWGNSLPFAPLSRNFLPQTYHSGSQNWAIAQDVRGVMYFGNNQGVLTFDGSRWELYPIPSGGVVRAVYMGADNRLYVGGFEEFGYFERNAFNRLVYHSLKQEVKDFDFHNDEIWTIIEYDGKIIFQSFGSYFIFNGKNTIGRRTEGLPLNMFKVGKTIYSQFIDEGLRVFNGISFQPLLDRKAVGNDDVVAGLPYPGGLLLLTRNSGGFIYADSKITPWQTECDAQLKHCSMNRAILTKDSCYIVGTLSDGVYALDRNGRLLWKENAENQLENNTVLGLYCDLDNNVWAALDFGIAYIQNNSQVYRYEPAFQKIGMVYDILVADAGTYIASNQGLYRYHNRQLLLLPGLEEQAWTINQWGNQVICGHNKGTFQIQDMQARLMSGVKGAACIREVQLNGQTILLQGTYTYLNIYKKNPVTNDWYFSNSIDNFIHIAKNLEVDHRGNIWVEHMQKGLYRVKLDPELRRAVDIRIYDSLNDDSNQRYALFKINGRVGFAGENRFYTYDDMQDSIVPYQAMNDQLADLKGIHTVNYMKNDFYWFISDKEAYLVQCQMNDFKVKRKISFGMFRNQPIEGRAKIVYDKAQDVSYLCLNNAVVRIAIDHEQLYHKEEPCALWVSAFSAVNVDTGDRKYFPVSEFNSLEAGFNNLTIALSYPAYADHSFNIRYKLEGLTDKWTEQLPGMKKEYSNLPFGEYCFKAEVYKGDQVLSSVRFPFCIMRPWYWSYAAITCYALLFLLSLALALYAVYAYTKRKKDEVIEFQRIRHQAEMEQQEKKIMELEKEQLEADLRFKSKELSSVVMTNIAHQEFLISFKEEIQQQRLAGQYTRKNFDRLLTLLEQNIVSDEENWNMFQANFDRIHENFFRHLKEQYPDLTSGDLRLCALLRLNLPTKEISKLMNISVRGVDAARYRLRKKLGLPQESSLTDFMINFK